MTGMMLKRRTLPDWPVSHVISTYANMEGMIKRI